MATIIKQGDCRQREQLENENIVMQYTLTDEGVLTISGNGELYGGELDWADPYYIDVLFSQFKDMGVNEVVIEEGVTGLGICCFANCRSLKKITIPSSVKTIGYKAFWECYELCEMVLPEQLEIESIGMDVFARTSLQLSEYDHSLYWGNAQNPYYACLRGSSDTHEIHNDTVVIVELAFADLKDCEKIVLPPSLKYISDEAFAYCSRLKEIELPEGLKGVGHDAFTGTSIQTLKLPTTIEYFPFAWPEPMVPNFIIPVVLKEHLIDAIKNMAEWGYVSFVDEHGNEVERLVPQYPDDWENAEEPQAQNPPKDDDLPF